MVGLEEQNEVLLVFDNGMKPSTILFSTLTFVKAISTLLGKPVLENFLTLTK